MVAQAVSPSCISHASWAFHIRYLSYIPRCLCTVSPGVFLHVSTLLYSFQPHLQNAHPSFSMSVMCLNSLPCTLVIDTYALITPIWGQTLTGRGHMITLSPKGLPICWMIITQENKTKPRLSFSPRPEVPLRSQNRNQKFPDSGRLCSKPMLSCPRYSQPEHHGKTKQLIRQVNIFYN